MKGKSIITKLFSAVAIIAVLISPLSSTSPDRALATVYSRTYTLDADFDEGVLVGVEHQTMHDQLQLSGEVTTYPIMWIANAGEDTVSKWDTENNIELARYHTWFGPPAAHDAWSGPSPSRTAVDLDGNCYVANRHFDYLPADVIKILADDWIDRNGNGVLDTSYDANSDGTISPSEMLPMTDLNGNGAIDDNEIVDERIAWAVSVGVPWGIGRSLAIDLNGNIWLGLYNTMEYYKLSGVDGHILAGPISVSPNTPYGALVDRYGILWGASLGWTLLKLDTNTDTVLNVYDHGFWGSDYGIALGYDSLGYTHVYQASQNGFTYIEFNSQTESFSTPAALQFSSLGIAVDSNGDIFASVYWGAGVGSVAKFKPDGSLLWYSNAQVASEARGTIVDSNDDVWIIHRDAHRLSKFSGYDGAALGVFNTGLYPYTYSDATGLGLRSSITSFGTWTTVFDSGEENTPWGTASWNSSEPEGTSVTVRVRSSNDQVIWSPWETLANGAPFISIPDGRYLQIEAALRILTGDVSPILYDLTVQVGNQPPIADADGPYTVQEGFGIVLDGTGSYDPDGDVLTYAWDLNGDGVFETPGATPTFLEPAYGIYPVALLACDPFGACDIDETVVYVTITPGIFPPELFAYLIPGESITEVKTVNVPPRPPKADVILAFDLTGSMGGILDTAKTRAAEIINELDALSGVDIQYGVMSYMDYPAVYSSCGYWASYGGGPDYAYRLDQAVTSNTGAIVSAINNLVLGWGNDGPQDYTRIFYESYADSEAGWRSGAKRILVNFGDNVPHDCNLNEGIVEDGVWSTGCDPGRDGVAETGDDLDLQAVLSQMASNGVVLLESHTSEFANNYWSYWTGLTGGDVFITTSGTLVDDIVGAVEDELTAGMVNGLHLEASPGFESWLVSVDPPSYDVDPGMVGVPVPFEIKIRVPYGTAPGEYHFTISAVDGAGVNYGDQQVTIIVLPPSMVTDSSLCTFDRNPEVEGQQFRLIFTPDLNQWPAFKLHASNPGQFFYNVFYAGDGPVHLDITIPEPFVTQGANPVHVYTARTVYKVDGSTCFAPDYASEIYAGDLAGLPVELPGGFLYVAVHLDYGLKGTTGYGKNGLGDAIIASTGEVKIPNFFNYTFAVGGSQNDVQTIQNINEFKKIPGVAGLVTDGDGNPIPNAPVALYNPSGKLVMSKLTDMDGWYMFEYKHTGKAAVYSVKLLSPYNMSKSVVLKANAFAEVDFLIP